MSPKRAEGKKVFLLIIPGSVLTGFGIGLALKNPAVGVVVGLGLGLLLQGLLISRRKTL